MELRDIKRIIEMMKQNELTEFELQDKDFKVLAKRGGAGDQPVVITAAPAAPALAPVAAPAAAAPGLPGAAPAAPSEDDGFVPIKSPMVGTFYRSPSPDTDSFVAVGQEIDEDTVVCIVEAMKVMNEIKAETRGIVKKILVDNATPVEFGQPLLLIEPA